MIQRQEAPPLRQGVRQEQRVSRRVRARTAGELGVSIGSTLLLLVVWELLVRAEVLDSRFFPAPTEVIRTLFEMIRSGLLLTDVWVTLVRVLIGFALGSAFGIVLGLVMGLSRIVRAALMPMVGAIYPIPKIAVLPLVMLIFGLGDTSRYVVVAIGVFFLVQLNAMAGVMSIENIYLDVGKNFGASRLDVLRTIALPGALPLVFTGLRLGWGTGLLLIVAAEFLGAREGLGYLIWNAWQTFAVDEMYVGLLAISVIGLVSFGLFDLVEKRVVPWRSER
ncbi:MAG: ABC transporter permease [bacterium]|jgi:NitT/TauT family transport system permease protein|nr:ABC transporter permease [bacterium]